MFAALRHFTPTIWLVIAATFAGRFVQFMVWPFLAILLHRRFGLDEWQVGLFLSIAATAGILFGFWVGYLSDRIGRRGILMAGLSLSAAAMAVLGLGQSLGALFFGTLLQSVARPMVEDPGRALMTDGVEDREVKDMALHMRFFALNLGAAIGPMVGAVAGLNGEQATFLILGGVHVAYLAAAAAVFRIEPAPPRPAAAARDWRLAEVMGVLSRDHAFLLFVLAGLLTALAYGQLDSALVQYLRVEGVADLARVYAGLIAVNAATIVLLQFPLLSLTRRLPPLTRAMYGVALFAAGFAGFALVPADTVAGLLFAMFVLSVGEAMLFPTISIITDRMAPAHLKGSYFGAASLSVAGFALAPAVGGAILFRFGGLALWLVMAAVAVLVAWLYLTANRIAASGARDYLT